MASLFAPQHSRSSRTALPDGVILRTRAPADTPDLFDLFNERTFLDNASTHGRFESHEDFEDWLNGIAPCGRCDVVAQSGPTVVAYGGLYRFADLMNHCGSLMLGVREDWQKQGLGSALLRTLLLNAEIIAGLGKVVLTVFTHNVDAIRLYRTMGSRSRGGTGASRDMAMVFSMPIPWPCSSSNRSPPRPSFEATH